MLCKYNLLWWMERMQSGGTSYCEHLIVNLVSSLFEPYTPLL